MRKIKIIITILTLQFANIFAQNFVAPKYPEGEKFKAPVYPEGENFKAPVYPKKYFKTPGYTHEQGNISNSNSGTNNNHIPQYRYYQNNTNHYTSNNHNHFAQNTPNKNDVKIWAVIVGVSNPKSQKLLKYADDDAVAFRAFLRSHEGGGVPDKQIKFFTNENATLKNILNALKYIAGMADRNDIIYFFFSGHGGEYGFCLYDGRLSYEKINDILDNCSAKHKFCFADACHSAELVASNENYNGRKSANSVLDPIWEELNPGFAFLLSSSKSSWEYGSIGHGVFTYYLIKGLKGLADSNNNKIITITELYLYVREKVKKYTDYEQYPVLKGEYNINLPVGTVR